MSRVRNAAIAVSENMACYENLANAIILQAVKDYKWALHRLDVNPKNRDAMHEKERLERFFHSPWYETLTDLDADQLIEGVKERVHQEAAKRRSTKLSTNRIGQKGGRTMAEEKNVASANEPGQVDCLELVKKLADSYRCLVRRRELLRQQYEESKSWFYTKEEIIYKLSQGAHEESERVQTSGLTKPVERTVLNCDKVLASMNREVQTQRTEQFLEPYYEVCEQIELFEIGLRSLRGQTRLVAEQLFVDGKKQSEITGAEGKLLTRRTVVREKENALIGMADTIGRYQRR